MKRYLCAIVLTVGSVQAQVAVPATSNAHLNSTSALVDGPFRNSKPLGRVGLVRGILKQLDPIHDELLVHAFGGGSIRIAFDPRTQFNSARTAFPAIPTGTVVSVDTVVEGGRLFALAVRTGRLGAARVDGEVVRYEAAKSQLTLRESGSGDDFSLRVTRSTTIVHHGQPVSPQSLSPGMLVQISFSPAQNAANRIDVLAQRGGYFAFEGKILAVDLRSRVLALSNDSDHSVRELTIPHLDAGSLHLLQEGALVDIQAEFDGNRYNIRSVTLAPHNP